MRYTILLNKNENVKDIEAQEQSRFVKNILEALEVPVDWNPEEPLSVDKRIEFRIKLSEYGIGVISDIDGGIKVYLHNDLIGEWYKCSYKLKKDASQVDPNKKLYLEMSVNFWTIYEK